MCAVYGTHASPALADSECHGDQMLDSIAASRIDLTSAVVLPPVVAQSLILPIPAQPTLLGKKKKEDILSHYSHTWEQQLTSLNKCIK